MLSFPRCLLIPDVHQDIAWVARILERERNYDFVVFMGDYFDPSLNRKRAGKSATCDYLMKLKQRFGNRVLFLLGNHDVQYLEAKPMCDARRKVRELFYQCGSAYTHAGARQVAKYLPQKFWDDARLFVAVNGFLVSHAGLAPKFWPRTDSADQALAALEKEAVTALATMERAPHWMLQAGAVRGGDAEIGGITWLDWDDEFIDGAPLPQIVGHTGNERGARHNGRSWCIDGRQTCYGVLTPALLEVKYV